MSLIGSQTLIDPLEDRLVSAFPTSGNYPGRVVIHSGLADMFFYCDGTEIVTPSATAGWLGRTPWYWHGGKDGALGAGGVMLGPDGVDMGGGGSDGIYTPFKVLILWATWSNLNSNDCNLDVQEGAVTVKTLTTGSVNKKSWNADSDRFFLSSGAVIGVERQSGDTSGNANECNLAFGGCQWVDE